MNIILLGPPGSGKGTQSENLIRVFDFFHISTGDIIRNNINNQTEFGMKAKKYAEQGLLVPDSLIINMIDKFLSNQKDKINFIWDGFPRTIAQAKALDKLLKNKHQKIDLVFYLDVAKKVLVERIINRVICPKCKRSYSNKFHKPKIAKHCDFDNEILIKRSDDNISKFKVRLATYFNETTPLIDYYKEELIKLKSNSSKNVIWTKIKGYINDKY